MADDAEARNVAAESRHAWAEFRAQIDAKLDAARPDRVGTNERDWREPVYGWARNHIPNESEIVRKFAQDEVDRREGQATKQGNKLLRAWLHGQLPLSWKVFGSKPIKVTETLRVRLDAATPEDTDAAAILLDKKAEQDYAEMKLLVSGYEDLGAEARRRRVAFVRLVGDLAPREQGKPIVSWAHPDDMPDPPDFGAVLSDEDDDAEAAP